MNAATPEATTNTELMRALRAAVGAPLGLPNPVWLLELGARLIRTETELVLVAAGCSPGCCSSPATTFSYPGLPEALAQIVAAGRRTERSIR